MAGAAQEAEHAKKMDEVRKKRIEEGEKRQCKLDALKRIALKLQAQLKETKQEHEETIRKAEEMIRNTQTSSDTEGVVFKAVFTKDETGARVVGTRVCLSVCLCTPTRNKVPM